MMPQAGRPGFRRAQDAAAAADDDVIVVRTPAFNRPTLTQLTLHYVHDETLIVRQPRTYVLPTYIAQLLIILKEMFTLHFKYFQF